MNIKNISALILLASSSLLAGCATVVNGTKQVVSIKTPPVKNAECHLVNSKGEWYVKNTPSSVTVGRAYGDLKVACTKNKYGTHSKKFKSSVHPMVFGNVIIGGVIGAGVDVATGSAYNYPQELVVPMTKKAELDYARSLKNKKTHVKKHK